MPDNRADRRADLGGAGRIFLDPHDFPSDPLVESLPQFRAVGADFFQFGVQAAQHALGHRGAQRPADQPAALLAHPFLDQHPHRVVLAGQQRLELAEHEVEHLLMAPAGDQHLQRPRHHPAGAGAAEQPGDHPGHHAPCPAVLHCLQQLRQHPGHGDGCAAGGGWVRQESPEDGRDIEPGQHARDLALGHHMVGDKPAEGAAEPGFLGRDDRRMRDRDAERVPEQRGDGEPVGDPTHEPGLGRRLQQFHPPAATPIWRHGIAGQGERRHAGHQGGRKAAMAPQRAASRVVVPFWLVHGAQHPV